MSAGALVGAFEAGAEGALPASGGEGSGTREARPRHRRLRRTRLRGLLGSSPGREQEQALRQVAAEPARHRGAHEERDDESDARTERDAEPPDAEDARLAPDPVRHVWPHPSHTRIPQIRQDVSWPMLAHAPRLSNSGNVAGPCPGPLGLRERPAMRRGRRIAETLRELRRHARAPWRASAGRGSAASASAARNAASAAWLSPWRRRRAPSVSR